MLVLICSQRRCAHLVQAVAAIAVEGIKTMNAYLMNNPASVRRMMRYAVDQPQCELQSDSIPRSQEDVDAIPADRRRLSFFTSMPAMNSAMVTVNILVGGSIRKVHAVTAEADAIRQGNIPMVRCFVHDSRIVPWYEWRAYNPYAHYFDAEEDGWTWLGCDVIACWRSVDKLDNNTERYAVCERDASTPAQLKAQRATSPWRVSRVEPAARKIEPIDDAMESVRRRLVQVLGHLDALEEEALAAALKQIDISGSQIDAERMRLRNEEANLRVELDKWIMRQMLSGIDKQPSAPARAATRFVRPRFSISNARTRLLTA